LKVSGLLTQYLYQHKNLNFPSIGRFTIDKAVTIPEQADKNYQEFLQHIQFIPKPLPGPDPELVEYIREKTGKIKPLAESDLESYFADCKFLLNIGKPVYLEGIGTLQKNKDGGFDFMHGQAMSERMEGLPPEKSAEKQGERRFLYNNEYTSQSGQGNALRKALIFGGIVVGLGVIVWGGYLLYSKKTNNETESNESVNIPIIDSSNIAPITPDSLMQSTNPDTTASKKITESIPPVGSYKFICEETENRQRALKRFQALQQVSNQFRLETKDSVRYTIYVVLPSSPADSAWKKDSLKAWYWGTRKRSIRIEQ
jgi:hypothetical protein